IWNIGVVDAPIESLLQNPVPDVRWLPAPPKGRYYADPFAVRADGRLHILFEDYCLSTKKGVISAIELDGGPATEAKMVMEQPGHMSYPFLLEHDGEIFCIPATADERGRPIQSTEAPRCLAEGGGAPREFRGG